MNSDVRNGQIVNDLYGALREHESGWQQAPKLLKRILQEGAWLRYKDRLDAVHEPRSWQEFVEAAPFDGLGTTMDVVDRIVGSGDPDLLRLLRDAKKVGRGRRTDLEPGSESEPGSINSERADYRAQRLARDHPDEYAAVERGEKSINRAAVDAGITRKRITVRLDDPASAARTLRAHMDPALIAELVALLISEDAP